MKFQFQWQGFSLVNLRLLVCDRCLDVPQPQLRTIIIPPDPLPIYNPRPEQYSEEVPSYMGTLTGQRMTTLSGVYMTMMIEVTPTPDPNQPYLAPPDF
jgi:hypothetical protein